MGKNLLERMGKKAGLIGVGVTLFMNMGCSPSFYSVGSKTYSLKGSEMKEMTKEDTVTYNVSSWGEKTLRKVIVNGERVDDEKFSEYRVKFIEGLRDIDSIMCEEFCNKLENEGHNRDSIKAYYDTHKSIF